MTLRNQSGYEWDTKVSVTEDREESTLGKVDAEVLGILITHLEGRPPNARQVTTASATRPTPPPPPRRNRGGRKVRERIALAIYNNQLRRQASHSPNRINP